MFHHRLHHAHFWTIASTDAAAEEQLRSNLNDGANAAALLGGIYGVEIPPGNVGAIDRIDSIRKIQLQLEAYDVAASVRFLGYNELAALRRPCIVPLRHSNDERTSFCIFVQANDADVHLVEAGPLTVRTMSVDDFRGYWTGYAVLGNVADTHYGDLLGWALFGSGLPLSGYGLYTYLCRRRRSSIRCT